MSNKPVTNTERFAAFMATLKAVTVYDFDGAHADNLNEMANRHHAIISAFADYIEADAKAFNEVAGAKLEATHGQLLDAVFQDEVAPNYQSERDILRAEEAQARSWGNAYDRGRQYFEERAA
ncbi:hypothetical protein [Labrys neptuniae]